MDRYEPQEIEPKWQRVWEDARAFYVSNPDLEDLPEREKFYMLEMLPYPSGNLHMGHVLNYTLGDVVTHHRRRSGFTRSCGRWGSTRSGCRPRMPPSGAAGIQGR